MSSVEFANASASPTAQALVAGQAIAASATGGHPAQKVGLPPAGLADAQTVSRAAESRGQFSGDRLLPLLTDLSHGPAEQALALIEAQAPKPGTAPGVWHGGISSSAPVGPTPLRALPRSVKQPPVVDPALVDPLWGRSA